jgi:hypothetical protein
VTVYVDDLRILATIGPYTSRWSHLFTDSEDLTELHDFAHSIGLHRSWLQDTQSGPHYDLNDRLRRRAITAGAQPIAWQNIPTLRRNRRTQRTGSCP